MYVKTQEGDLVLLFHYRRIFTTVTNNIYSKGVEIRADDNSIGGCLLGVYQDKECAKLVMGKIEEAIVNSEKLMKMPTKEDVSRWSE